MTSQIPLTTFTHSLDLEGRKLLYVASKLAKNIYQNRGYLVLPAAPYNALSSTIIFPDLPYNQIPKFWQKVTKLKNETPANPQPELLNAATKLIKPIYDVSSYENHLKECEISFKSIEYRFWHNLFTLFPQYKNKVAQVNIISTQLGSFSTFSLASKDHSTIHIYLRQDATLGQLLWTILASIFRPHLEYDLKYTWEEIEALIDWLMHDSSLNCGVNFHAFTIKKLRNHDFGEYKLHSRIFLTKLGIGSNLKLEKYQGKYKFDNTIIDNLGQQEEQLLGLLFANSPQVVSYEQIAQTLWPDNGDWTLYAIVKAIQRLRSKLLENKIVLPLIKTHRKIGYSIL